MLEALARNYNNRNEKACLYELATIYLPTSEDKLPEEKSILICGMYGEGSDFFAAKGMVEELLDRLGVGGWDIEASSEEYSYHPGRCARLSVGGEALGVIGEIHPEVVENYGMEGRAVSFSLDVDTLFRHARLEKAYTPLPRFPAVSRDLALVCDDGIPVKKLEKAIREGAGGLLENVKLFDVYRGEQIAPGKKSVAFSVNLRSADSTLTEERVSGAMKKVIKELEKAGAALRL
jgi:phenylalanyl-tRNA synthetase beta chain